MPTQTWLLTPTVTPVVADNLSVTWSSSDNSVAEVDANGLVSAVDDGTATITVTTDESGFTATCAITVTTRLTDVYVNPTIASLEPSETLQLTSAVIPDSAIDLSVTWSSDDVSVATVDDNGLVTAVADGTATITVTTNDRGLTASSEITVFTNAKGVSVNPTTLTLALFESADLTATITPPDATNPSVTWVSDNPSVARVNDNGQVKGYANGTASITVITNDGNFTDTCKVTVGTGINVVMNSDALNPINLFPNPTNSILNIVMDMEYENSVVSIADLSGRLQISELLPGSENLLDLSSLNQGIYNLYLKNGEIIIYREKIVKIN